MRPPPNSEDNARSTGCWNGRQIRNAFQIASSLAHYEFAEAAENYTKSTELDDKFVFSHIQLAVAQYKSDNLANSMATFRRTLKAFPDRSEPQNY